MCAASRYLLVTLLWSMLAPATSNANAEPPDGVADWSRARTEVWLAVSSWAGVADLQPAAGGSFDATGYGLGAAVHWPVRAFENTTLLVGIEGALIASESNVPVYFDDLLARDAYVAVSSKWLFGDKRNVSLDAGLAYHLLDIAQLETNYYTAIEFESWEESAAGLFVGITWDVGAGRPGKNSGLSLGLRVHVMDFGTVRDEDVLFEPVLGDDAGNLQGPLVALQIGYRWR